MRIAAFVLGLILSLIILGGAFFCFFASAIGTGIGNLTESEEIARDAQGFLDAAGYGFFLAILGIVGASLAFKYRAAPTVLLLLAAIGSIFVGIYTPHANMIVWGGLLILPAIFAGVSRKKTSKVGIE